MALSLSFPSQSMYAKDKCRDRITKQIERRNQTTYLNIKSLNDFYLTSDATKRFYNSQRALDVERLQNVPNGMNANLELRIKLYL